MTTIEPTLEEVVEKQKARIKELEEQLVMCLAAISTASIQNTDASRLERISQDNPYWTIAYSDVCTAVNREMNLRKKLDKVEVMLKDCLSIY